MRNRGGICLLSGSKLAAQNVGIGTAAPVSRLHVAGTNPTLTVGSFGIGQAEGRIVATGSAAELSFVRRTRTNWNPPINAGDRWVWYSPDGTARLWTEGNGDLVTVTPIGWVGIGTISPLSKLHVHQGAVRVFAHPTVLVIDNENETGNPAGDMFRMRWDIHFYGTQRDAIIIEKTDGNDSLCDGGIAFTAWGTGGV